MKAYSSAVAITVPLEWAAAAECALFRSRCYVLIIAPDKPGAVALLTDRAGLPGARIAGECRALPLTGHSRTLVDAGVVRLARPGVYIYRPAFPDAPVIRVDHGGDLTLVARFGYAASGIVVYPLSVPYVAGHMPPPDPGPAAREARRRELARMTKATLAAMAARTLVASMHPPGKWTKPELISYALDREFPRAVVEA